MGNAANELQTRIVWCQHQRRLAVTRDEAEGWQAEEAGLSDALHGVDRTEHWNNFSPSRVTRYQVGLRDGLALRAVMRLRHCSNRDREAAQGLGLVASTKQAGETDSSASPSARSFKTAG
ncbi:MAG: hypothetical protein E6K63_05720 [Nitrospirae bacterium]|nr:MAG: hypothetical protein E6K63_05720 [Nitrospirota bacterium]